MTPHDYESRRRDLRIVPTRVNKKPCWHVDEDEVEICALLFLLYVVEVKHVQMWRTT